MNDVGLIRSAINLVGKCVRIHTICSIGIINISIGSGYSRVCSVDLEVEPFCTFLPDLEVVGIDVVDIKTIALKIRKSERRFIKGSQERGRRRWRHEFIREVIHSGRRAKCILVRNDVCWEIQFCFRRT
ncbi:hypothetical protein D3C87_1723410 [compost metagenome]